jgi:streptogramin lyase
MSGNVTLFNVRATSMIAGPDSHIWALSGRRNPPEDLIARMGPLGGVTYYKAPCAGVLNNWEQITSGADGNLWFTVNNVSMIVRMTTAGISTCFSTTAGTEGVTAGPDGNVWFTEPSFSSSGLIGKITPAGVVTEYADPNNCRNIISAGDGYLYADSNNGIARISPADGSETIVAPQVGAIWNLATSGSGAEAKLYYSAPDNHLITLHLASDRFDIDVLPAGQTRGRYVAYGPDGNLWYSTDPPSGGAMIGVDVLRSMTVNPTSITLTVGQSQSATASQTKNRNDNFTATSANTAIATVANGSGPGDFNITGVSAGSTTVRIADRVHNWVDIAVTVH